MKENVRYPWGGGETPYNRDELKYGKLVEMSESDNAVKAVINDVPFEFLGELGSFLAAVDVNFATDLDIVITAKK